jgi:hypothetical protein
MGPGDERRDDIRVSPARCGAGRTLGVIPVLVTGIHRATSTDRRADRNIATPAARARRPMGPGDERRDDSLD